MNKNADFFHEIILQQGGETTPESLSLLQLYLAFFQLQAGSSSRYVIVIAFAFLIKEISHNRLLLLLHSSFR